MSGTAAHLLIIRRRSVSGHARRRLLDEIRDLLRMRQHHQVTRRHVDRGRLHPLGLGLFQRTLLESHGERAAGIIVSQAAAWSADLIIMGTHGRKGLGGLFLGSDAAEVARAAPVPLLLLRGP